MQLLLSLFPGIDLLGRGFEAEGFCVVRGPDLLWGQDVRGFHVPAGKFDGVIGGPPCQDFSALRRVDPTGEGDEMLQEFRRLVTEAGPEWWLLENVPRVPDVRIAGYTVQRIQISAREAGVRQQRWRCFQFGHRDPAPLIIPRNVTPAAVTDRACLATEGSRTDRRTFAQFAALQGLPSDFDLPGWPRATKYRAVGNGVPIPLAQMIARAIRERDVTRDGDAGSVTRVCECGCGRAVFGKWKTATPTCRKRLERRRKSARCCGSPVSCVPRENEAEFAES